MSIKNILNLSAFGGLLLLTALVAVIVDPLAWCGTAGVSIYAPEVFSEVE